VITAIIQARFSSTRLPGKVLLPLGDKTVLERVVDRVSKAKNISQVVLATSSEKDDDQIFELCNQKGVKCFRGDLNDVLDRYYQAAKEFEAKNICRITADCPLIDPEIIDRVADKFLEAGYDYISTGRITSTFPDGMDTEIFTFESLERAWKEAKLSSEREHVTPYIWKNTDKFKIYTYESGQDLSSYRLTLDEEKDYQLIKNIYENLEDLSMKSIIDYLNSHLELTNINSSIKRDEGYDKSLKND